MMARRTLRRPGLRVNDVRVRVIRRRALRMALVSAAAELLVSASERTPRRPAVAL